MENSDKTPKVTGIGGIFFFSDDPKETRDWCAKNLGMDTTEWGTTFESRNSADPDIIESMQWSPFKRGSSYFLPSKKEFMINYRVQNIEELVKNLRQNNVTILDHIVDSEYGKFVHILDSDDNKIELWEAPENK